MKSDKLLIAQAIRKYMSSTYFIFIFLLPLTFIFVITDEIWIQAFLFVIYPVILTIILSFVDNAIQKDEQRRDRFYE